MARAMTRRELFKDGLIAVAGAAAGSIATSAVAGADGSDDDWGEHLLPPGSVVTLKGNEGTDVKYMVVCRKPYATAVRKAGKDKTQDVEGKVYDYALALWPFGFVSNLSDRGWGAEMVAADRSDITSVLFVGYRDPDGYEQSLTDKLEAAGASDNVNTVLGDDLAEYMGKSDGDEESAGGE